MGRKRSVPIPEVRTECRRLVEYLRQAGHSAESLANIEPGGPENPDPGPRGYLVWHGQLNQRFAADQVRASLHRETDGKAEADAEALAALAARPEPVTLVSPVDGKAALMVHPKSVEALMAIGHRDVLMGKLTALRAKLIRSTDPDDLDLLRRTDAELAHQLGWLTWAVTHDGPGLPAGDPPAWVGELDPWDMHQVVKAHHLVNGKRLQALGRLVAPTEGDAKAPQWSVFVASVASEMGVQPRVMLRDWSLGEVLSTARLAGEAKRAAHEAARSKAKAA